MLEHLQPIIQKSVTRSFSAGATVLYQGEVPRSAFILVKGVVRVFSISPQGDEQIVTYHTAGEFFPVSWIFGKTPGSLYFFETVDESEIAFVPRDELIDFMLAAPARTRAMLDYFTTSYAASLIRISALEQAKAREKLIYTLYYLCQRYGKPKGSRVGIELSLTHQNLAGLVGVTRETTATEMAKLKKQGILTYENQRYTVNLEKLLEMIGEDSFRGINIR